jgi:acetyl-CoA carboxylase biotin carboxyl carrier protein
MTGEVTGVDATVPGTPPEAGPEAGARDGSGDGSLLGLVDRLTELLEHSDLAELEVEVGGTGLVLRSPAALGSSGVALAAAAPAEAASPAEVPAPAAAERPAVRAPLTGIWYPAPAPGAAPYVEAGSEIVVGQVVGLIEAMKLFNEIKTDIAGRVVRVIPDSGQLVKAKQALIEVEPL